MLEAAMLEAAIAMLNQIETRLDAIREDLREVLVDAELRQRPDLGDAQSHVAA